VIALNIKNTRNVWVNRDCEARTYNVYIWSKLWGIQLRGSIFGCLFFRPQNCGCTCNRFFWSLYTILKCMLLGHSISSHLVAPGDPLRFCLNSAKMFPYGKNEHTQKSKFILHTVFAQQPRKVCPKKTFFTLASWENAQKCLFPTLDTHKSIMVPAVKLKIGVLVYFSP
jgi:hypothetical protein